MRTTTRSFFLLFITCCFMVFVGGNTVAKGDFHEGNRHGKKDDRSIKRKSHSTWHLLHVMEKLDLSTQQRSEMLELHREWKLELIDLEADVRKRKVELQTYVHGKKPGRTRIKQLVNDLYDAKAGLHRARIEHRMDRNEILTDAQIEQLKDFRKKHRMHGKTHKKHCNGDRTSGSKHRYHKSKHH